MKKLNELQSYLTRLRGLMLTLVILLTIGSGNVWGAVTSPITLTTNKTNVGYDKGTMTLTDVFDYKLTFSSVTAAGADYVQNAKSSSFYNTVAIPGSITSIKLTDCATTSSKTDGGFTVYGGTTQANCTTSVATISGLSSTAADKTINFTGSYTFFKVTVNSARVLKISSIVISFSTGGGCENQVTITNSTTTDVSHGSFDVNKTGAQDACSALSVVVTPDPDEHYHVASVSATDPATTGTAGAAVDNGDGTWTITYSANSKGASTVNVTFAADDPASITLSEAGATSSPVGTYYPGDSYTLPTSTSASCGTKTLVGWSTVTVAETNTKPASNFYELGESVTLVASQTFYAVFAQVAVSETKFKRVTSASEITEGQKVAIVNNSNGKILGMNDGGTAYTDNSAPSETSSQIDKPSLNNTWTASKSGDYWEFTNCKATSKKVATSATASQSVLSPSPQTYTKFELGANSSADNMFYLRLYDGSSMTYCALQYYNSNWQVYAPKSGGNYTYASNAGVAVKLYVPLTTYSAYTTTCSCPSYSFNYGPLSGESNWETPLCFEFETGTTDTYYIKNFTIPTTVTSSTQFYVGWQGVFQGDNEHPSYSQTWNIVDNNPAYNKMRLTHSLVVDGESNRDFVPVLKIENANVCGLGAQGTLKVCGNHNNNYDNKYVGFIPAGYALNWGPTVGDWETPLAFTAASNNIEETVWTTDIVTLTSIRKAYNYYVGLKTASGNVYSGRSSTRAISGMPAKSGTDSWEGSGVSNVAANSRGKFRVWADNNQLNWNCHFVPYIGVTYYDADNSSVFEQTSDANAVSIEADANDKKFTITSSEPTKANYTFVGWNTSANQTTATYTSGQTNVALSAWTYLYPAFTENPKANVIVNPSSNGSVVADHTTNVYQGTTVTLTITPSSGYQLSSISAVDGSSNPVSLSGTGNSRTFTMPASNVTVTATFVIRTDYVLVESALDDYSGEYLIVYHSTFDNFYALSGRQGNKNTDTYGTTTDVTTYYDADAKAIASNATTDAMKMIIEPGQTANTYTIYFENDNSYLGMTPGNTATGNKLRFVTSANLASNSYEWTISLPTGKTYHYISMLNNAVSPTRYYLNYNTDNSKFGLYTNQSDPELYKKAENCTKLAAPTGLAEADVTQTTATLSWNAVDNASGYEVSLDGGSNWTSTGTNRTYSVTEGAGWTQGTSHTWKVRATGDGTTYCDKGSQASHTVTMKAAVTVTYHSNGSTGGQLPVVGGVVNLTEGDSHTILGNTGSGGSPTPLTKSGYTFAGWHSSSTYSATPAYTIGGSITVNSSIIIYANWAPKRDTYKDAVHGNADQYGDGKYTVPAALSDATRHTSGTCEETHYKFIGWCKEGQDPTNPANIVAPGTTNKPATGVNYYAVWAEEL